MSPFAAQVAIVFFQLAYPQLRERHSGLVCGRCIIVLVSFYCSKRLPSLDDQDGGLKSLGVRDDAFEAVGYEQLL